MMKNRKIDLPCDETKMLYRFCLLIGIFFATIPIGFADGKSGIERLLKFNKTVTSYQARFQQKIINEKQELLEDTKGVMYLQRPGKFRWEYQKPYSHLIVADGDKVWLYDQELESVTVKSFSKGIGDTPAMILSSHRPLDENFYIREIGLQQKLAWAKLIPKSPGPNFDYILLGFDNRGLQTLKFVDKLGQTTIIQFSSVIVNPNLPQRLFRFTPPPGADIVGAEG